ncbi:hypothetical protein ACHAXR_004356 [Thalassiosira sp. AJA248-18]
MTSEGSDLAPGGTSLEALSLAIAWLDGDANAGASTSNKNTAPALIPSNGATANSSEVHQTPIEKAIVLLTDLQTQISRNGLISKNEVLDDVPTSSLELLGVEYQLGRALLMLPTHVANAHVAASNNNGSHNGSTISNGNNGPSPSLLRKRNVTRANEYFHSFLKRLEQLGEGMLEEATLKEYHALLDLEDMGHDDDNNKPPSSSRMNPSQIREMKIQRFQRKKSTTQKRSQLQSQLQRRSRLGLADEDPMEGHDFESLSRTLFIESLRMHAEESLEEIQSSRGEFEMLDMAIKMESMRMQQLRDNVDPRMNNGGRALPPPQAGTMAGPPPHPSNQPPLQMTQVTQHPITGQLEFTKQRVSNGQLQPIVQQKIQRQEISNGVFRPSWNQPTMSLEELGERERADAIQRAEAQTIVEAEAKFKPKRYDQLVKDGMEDDEKLVEASAKLDREWDDWKDENPRGSGNKMGERGDRNF